jgi:integrase
MGVALPRGLSTLHRGSMERDRRPPRTPPAQAPGRQGSPPSPVSPALGRLLRKHIAEHGTAPDGRLFQGEGGGLLSDTVYGRAWEKARQTALTPAQEASPLAERPYDLRHARLSSWLNAGVAPAQVAEWAGNSVPVLLRVYAKCLTDSEQTALRRIEEAEERQKRRP